MRTRLEDCGILDGMKKFLRIESKSVYSRPGSLLNTNQVVWAISHTSSLVPQEFVPLGAGDPWYGGRVLIRFKQGWDSWPKYVFLNHYREIYQGDWDPFENI